MNRRRFIKTGLLWLAAPPVIIAATPQQVLLLSKPPAAPAASSASYIISEDWETTSGIWSVQNDPTGIDMAYTAAPIEGAKSLWALGKGTAPPYVYNTTLFANQDDISTFFLLKLVAGPTSDDYARTCFWFVDSANAHQLKIDVHRVNATNYNLRVYAGVAGSTTTTATFNVGAIVAVWSRYRNGTGNNAKAEVWWTPWAAAGDAIKPADGSNWYAYRGDGGYTTHTQRVQYGALLSGGQGLEVIFDHIRVSASTLGNNPA